MVDKLASITPAWKNLAAFVCWFWKGWQTKSFDISTGYMKCVAKFWGEIYSENCQLFSPISAGLFLAFYDWGGGGVDPTPLWKTMFLLS